MRTTLLFILFLLISACQHHPINKNAKVIYAQVETQPVANSDDAADDPAIWINQKSTQNSLVLGTDKRQGLAVYNLQGKQVQFLNRGRLNNVDLRQGISIDNNLIDIAVATNRTHQTLDIFYISEMGKVKHVAEQALTIADPYGVCMHLDSQGLAYAFVNGKEGEYQQWQLNSDNQLKPKLIGEFKLDSQPEGCSVDDQTATLYLGEENFGFWQMPADASRASEKVLLDKVSNNSLTADVEGMEIYHNDQYKLLIVSSQGDHSYAVYDLNDANRYLGSFRIADNPEKTIDGTQETDGLTVTSVNLGSQFPQGVLVVQDGFNERPTENQNFKIIDWRMIVKALGL